jgi:hypothetical protein
VSDRLDLAIARDALEAIWEALSIPHAATAGDDEVRGRILELRVTPAVVVLGALLGKSPYFDGHPVTQPQTSIGYLREQLAKYPAEGYRTWDQAVAERQAAEAGEPR